jgi:hypothetical protein
VGVGEARDYLGRKRCCWVIIREGIVMRIELKSFLPLGLRGSKADEWERKIKTKRGKGL